MAIGTELSTLRAMLKAEIGAELDDTVAPGNIALYTRLLNNQQAWLVGEHAFLNWKVRVTLPVTVGTRYYDLPDGIDFQRLEKPVYTNYNGFRYEIHYGISQPHLNVFRSDDGVTGNPVMRWQIVDTGDGRQIEVWPVPQTAQELIFTGVGLVTDMEDDTDTAVVDDLMLVLFTAAEILAREKSADAGAKLAKAQSRLNRLRADAGSEFESFRMHGAGGIGRPFTRDFKRPVVGVSMGH